MAFTIQRCAMKRQVKWTLRWLGTVHVQTIPSPECLFVHQQFVPFRGRSRGAETLSEARGLYPREQSLIIEELNIYLTNEEFDKAKENLTLPQSRIRPMKSCGPAWAVCWTISAMLKKPLMRTKGA